MEEQYEYKGKKYTYSQLKEKYGDNTDKAIQKFGFVKTEQEPTYEYKGKTYTRSELDKKYGNKTDEAISKFGFTQKGAKKKAESESTSPNPKSDSVEKSGSSASQKQNPERELMQQMGDAYMKEQNTPEAVAKREEKKAKQAITKTYDDAYNYAVSNLDQAGAEERYNEELTQNTLWKNTKKGFRNFHNTWIGKPSNAIARMVGSDADFTIAEPVPLEEETKQAKKELLKENPDSEPTTEQIQERAKKIFIDNDLQNQMHSLVDKALPSGYDREGVWKELKLKSLRNNDVLRSKIASAEMYKSQIEEFKDFYEGIDPENPTQEEVEKYNILREKAMSAVGQLENLSENFDTFLSQAKTDEEKLELFKYNYNDWEKNTTSFLSTLENIGAGALKLAGETLEYGNKKALEFNSERSNTVLGKLGMASNVSNIMLGKVMSDVGSDTMEENEKLTSQFYRYKASDIHNWSDFGSVTAQVVSEQLPILATMYLGGNIGLGIVSASSGGQKIHEMETEEKSGGKKFSDGEKLIAGYLYTASEGLPERLGTVKILKDIEKTVNSASKSSRKLFNKGALKEVSKQLPESLKKLGYYTGLETATERVTTESQILIDEEFLGIELSNQQKREMRAESDFASAIMGGGMAMTGGMLSIVAQQAKTYSDKKDVRAVQDILKKIDVLRNEIDTNDLLTNKEVTELYREMNVLNNQAFDIVERNAIKGADLSLEEKSFLIDINTQQEELRAKAKETADSNLSEDLKKAKLKELETRFNELESKREETLSGGYTPLTQLSTQEVTDLKNRAGKELKQEMEAKGETEFTLTDEQISKRAVEIYKRENTKENNAKFVNDENRTKQSNETRLDNGRGVESSSERELVGRRAGSEAVYRTAEASNSGGSQSSVFTVEEREELEARGINPDWDKKKFKKNLKEQAQQNDTWLDDSYLDDKIQLHDQKADNTTENDVYLSSDGKTVTKVNNLALVSNGEHSNNLTAFIDRIEAHNALFPDNPITIIGYAHNKHGEPSVVLEQPYIDAERNATKEEITEYLESKGFKLDGKREWSLGSEVWSNGVYELFDARPANVIKGKDGKLYFFDTVPHSVEYMNQSKTKTNETTPSQNTDVDGNVRPRTGVVDEVQSEARPENKGVQDTGRTSSQDVQTEPDTRRSEETTESLEEAVSGVEKTSLEKVLAEETAELERIEKKYGKDSREAKEQRSQVNALKKQAPTEVTFENGKVVVTGRGSRNQTERNQAVRESAIEGAFDNLPRALNEDTAVALQTNEEVSQYVADNSTNPIEIAEQIESEKSDKGVRELTSARDFVLNFFESGGRITQNVLQELFGGNKAGERKNISGEVNARKSLVRKDGVNTIDDIAHQIWESLPNELQEQIDTSQIRDAVESVLSENNTVEDMRNELYGEQGKSPVQQDLEQRFEEITGLPATKRNIELFTKKETDQVVESDKKVSEKVEETIDDDVPFQNESRNFKTIAKEKFDALVKQLQKVLPVNVKLFDSKQLSEILGVDWNKAKAQAYWDKVNDTFNNELDRFAKLPKEHIFKLGLPSAILRASGIANLPIELSKSTLDKKSSGEYKKNHPFDVSSLKDIVKALQNPIAIFNNPNNDGKVVLTELQHNGVNHIVVIKVRTEKGVNQVEIDNNSVVTVFPKDRIEEIADWIKDTEQGRKVYFDKEKSSKWLSDNGTTLRSKGHSIEDLANIINNFENPITDNEVQAQVEDLGYKGSHIAPGKEGNNSLDNMSDVFPDDLYSSKRLYYYADDPNSKSDKESYKAIREAKGKPDKKVKVYRAVPKGVTKINSGDWVSLSKNYAKEHGERVLDGEYEILETEVEASKLFNEGSINEFGVQFLYDKQGTVYGFVKDGQVYIDQEAGMNANTPIHEFGHVWLNVIKNGNKEIYDKVINAIKKDKALMDEVRNDPSYKHLKTDDQVADEVLAKKIGDIGEQKYETAQERKEARDKMTMLQKITDMLVNQAWEWVKSKIGQGNDIRNWSKTKWQTATVEDVANAISGELLSGKRMKESKTEKFLDLLNEWQKEPVQFSRETLGVNIPVSVGKGMINAMRKGTKAGLNLTQAYQMGIDYLKDTDWYKNLSKADRSKVDANDRTFKTVINNAVRQLLDSEKKLNAIREKLSDDKVSRKEVADSLNEFLKENKIEGKITPTEVNRLALYASRIATATNPQKAFDNFLEQFNKIELRASTRVQSNKLKTEMSIKENVIKKIEKMLDKNISETDILNSFTDANERKIADEYLEIYRKMASQRIAPTSKKDTVFGRLKKIGKKFQQKWFSNQGGLLKPLIDVMDDAVGNKNIALRRANQLVKDTEKEAKRVRFSDWDLFSDALSGDKKALDSLPPTIKNKAVEMRLRIDGLTDKLISMGAVSPEQALLFEQNKGSYVSRTYDYFYQNKTKRKIMEKLFGYKGVSKKAYEEAFNFFAHQSLRDMNKNPQYQKLSDAEKVKLTQEEAEKRINEYMNSLESEYQTESAGRGKDTSVLEHRKAVPSPIRKLLGEHTDPRVKFIMTIARMSNLAYQHEMLTKVKKIGINDLFFEENDSKRPATHFVKLASDNSSEYSPLNGLYTTPEFKEAFLGVDKQTGDLVKLWSKTTGYVKYGMTILSPITQSVNFFGNTGFLVMNGLYDVRNFKHSASVFYDEVFTNNQSRNEFVELLIKKNIIGQSTSLNEIKSDIADTFEKDLLKKLGNKGVIYKSIRFPFSMAEKTYKASDDFFKAYSFYNEADSYSKALYGVPFKDLIGEQREEIINKAAEVTKNTLANYDRVYKGSQLPRKITGNLVGNFLSFQGESARTLINAVQIMREDLKNPKTKSVGIRRLVGIMTYLSTYSAMQYTLAKLSGMAMMGLWSLLFDDDEGEEEQRRDDFNRASAPWTRGTEKLYKENEDGTYSYYTVGNTNPYKLFFETINVLSNEKDGGVKGALGTFTESFIGTDLTLKTLLDVAYNQDNYGREIGGTMSRMSYIGKQLSPGFVKEIIKNTDDNPNNDFELINLMGVKKYELNPTDFLNIQTSKFQKEYNDLSNKNFKIQYRFENDEWIEKENISLKEMAEIKNNELDMKRISLEFMKDYESAVRLGADTERFEDNISKEWLIKYVRNNAGDVFYDLLYGDNED